MAWTLPMWEPRRLHALQYIDERMAKIKAQDLRESGLVVSLEEY